MRNEYQAHHARGDLLASLYRLGRQAATGTLIVEGEQAERLVFVLRRGAVLAGATGQAIRATRQRLSTAAYLGMRGTSKLGFEGGGLVQPPGGEAIALTEWVREHLVSQVDARAIDRIVSDFAGARLRVRRDMFDGDTLELDELDQAILEGLRQPRRLDQLIASQRGPRFRTFAFLYFLRGIGALELEGVTAERSRRYQAQPPHLERHAAARTLGVGPEADAATIRRAYHRLAKAAHPDLFPTATVEQRLQLEARLRALTTAYRQLRAAP